MSLKRPFISPEFDFNWNIDWTQVLIVRRHLVAVDIAKGERSDAFTEINLRHDKRQHSVVSIEMSSSLKQFMRSCHPRPLRICQPHSRLFAFLINRPILPDWIGEVAEINKLTDDAQQRWRKTRGKKERKCEMRPHVNAATFPSVYLANYSQQHEKKITRTR